MNVCNGISNKSLSCQLIVICLVVSISACANRAELRDKERAHYENLESELLNEQQAKNRRLRDEYRVDSDIQPSDSVKLSANDLNNSNATNQRSLNDDAEAKPGDSSKILANGEPDTASPNTASEDSITVGSEAKAVETDATNAAPNTPSPVVTQIVVGQPAEGASEPSWNRQNYPSPVTGSPLCAVVSIPVVVQNGELDTQVSIVVSNDAVFLRTDATFDTSAIDIGFQIDAGFPIPFDRYLNELTAVIDENYPIVLGGLKNGTTLSVSFAYEPQLSSSDTHVVELTLDSFRPAWSEMAQCSIESDG